MRPIVLTLLLFLAWACPAADIYVAQTAQGGDTGVDAANAHSLSWLNTSGNWGAGAGKINAGTTVHLVGTLQGGNSAEVIYCYDSGTSNSPITLYFEPNAKVLAPYFAPAAAVSGGIVVRQKNYITIDGGVNGMVACTNNGTDLGFQQESCGIYLRRTTGVTVKNLTITNIYVNGGFSTNCTDVGGQFTYDVYCYDTNIYTRVCSNRLFSSRCGIGADPGGTLLDHLEIDHNYVADHCWGISVATGDAGSVMTNIEIHDNEITDWTNWQFPGGLYPPDTYHTDGIITYNRGTSSPFRERIYNNYIHGDMGGGSPTALIFVTYGTDFADHSAIIYNNLLVITARGTALWTREGTTNHLIYNNTLIGPATNSYAIIPEGRCYLSNNIVSGWNYAIGGDGINITNTVAASDRNVFYNIASTFIKGLYTYTTNQWIGFGYEGNSRFSNPVLSASYHPLASSSAIGVGANLSSLFTTDKDGLMRPAFGFWDGGAYRYGTNNVYRSRFGSVRSGKISL